MKRINFDSLRKCDDLYNYQSNVFEFENGIVDEVGAFYPIPIKARDLIMQGHYSKPIDSNTPDKLTKFNYQSYFEGVKSGYNELLPKDNAGILELAVTTINLKYIGNVCQDRYTYEFGVAVGRSYHAWIYIADNVDEFARAWNLQKKIYENLNKNFADYLTCENKDAMIEKIATLVNGQKGKRIAYVINCLNSNNLIKYFDAKYLYQSMRLQFTFETSDQSINDYISNQGIEKYKPKERIEIEEIKKILSTN